MSITYLLKISLTMHPQKTTGTYPGRRTKDKRHCDPERHIPGQMELQTGVRMLQSVHYVPGRGLVLSCGAVMMMQSSWFGCVPALARGTRGPASWIYFFSRRCSVCWDHESVCRVEEREGLGETRRMGVQSEILARRTGVRHGRQRRVAKELGLWHGQAVHVVNIMERMGVQTSCEKLVDLN